MADEILELTDGTDDLVLVGIQRRGVQLADRLVDLIAASVSSIAVGGFVPQQLGMLIFIAPGVLSYIYYRKKLREEGIVQVA